MQVTSVFSVLLPAGQAGRACRSREPFALTQPTAEGAGAGEGAAPVTPGSASAASAGSAGASAPDGADPGGDGAQTKQDESGSAGLAAEPALAAAWILGSAGAPGVLPELPGETGTEGLAAAAAELSGGSLPPSGAGSAGAAAHAGQAAAMGHGDPAGSGQDLLAAAHAPEPPRTPGTGAPDPTGRKPVPGVRTQAPQPGDGAVGVVAPHLRPRGPTEPVRAEHAAAPGSASVFDAVGTAGAGVPEAVVLPGSQAASGGIMSAPAEGAQGAGEGGIPRTAPPLAGSGAREDQAPHRSGSGSAAPAPGDIASGARSRGVAADRTQAFFLYVGSRAAAARIRAGDRRAEQIRHPTSDMLPGAAAAADAPGTAAPAPPAGAPHVSAGSVRLADLEDWVARLVQDAASWDPVERVLTVRVAEPDLGVLEIRVSETEAGGILLQCRTGSEEVAERLSAVRAGLESGFGERRTEVEIVRMQPAEQGGGAGGQHPDRSHGDRQRPRSYGFGWVAGSPRPMREREG